MLAQGADDFFTPAVDDILFEFLKRDVHHVMVMEFFGRDFVAEFEPDAVQQIHFFRSKSGRVRSKIKDVLLSGREHDFKRQLWLWIGKTLPRKAREACFFGHRAGR